jgi:hypothetical protein
MYPIIFKQYRSGKTGKTRYIKAQHIMILAKKASIGATIIPIGYQTPKVCMTSGAENNCTAIVVAIQEAISGCTMTWSNIFIGL